MARTHLVRRGECLSTIARRYGLSDWRTVWDHPENGPLKERRGNPNVLYPGDRLFIPDPEPREESAQTEQVHRFVVKRDAVHFRMRLQDRWGGPLASCRYRLEVRGQAFEGETDGDGRLEERVPEDATRGLLTVWLAGDELSAHHWEVRLGDLDPETEVSGVQGRLHNLGFPCGPIDGLLGPKTAAALREFQSHHGLPVTGEIDQATRAELKRRHLDT